MGQRGQKPAASKRRSAASKTRSAAPAQPRKPRKAAQAYDWARIEADYRAGLTKSQCARKHGCTPQAVSQRAQAGAWQQDLTGQVRAATKAALIADAVQAGVSATTDAVVAAAEANKSVVLAHRSDIRDVRGVAFDMLGELHATTHNRTDLEAVFKLVYEDTEPLQRASVREAFKQLTGLHKRVASVTRLAATVATLQRLERAAFGLDKDDEREQGEYEKRLRELYDEEVDE